MKRILVGCFFTVFILACAGKEKPSGSEGDVADGAKLYKQYCVLCHGADGKLGLNGAKDMTASLLTLEERIALIRTGKNLMTPFEGILTPEQIKAVAEYTMQLK